MCALVSLAEYEGKVIGHVKEALCLYQEAQRLYTREIAVHSPALVTHTAGVGIGECARVDGPIANDIPEPGQGQRRGGGGGEQLGGGQEEEEEEEEEGAMGEEEAEAAYMEALCGYSEMLLDAAGMLIIIGFFCQYNRFVF
jgi:hypothetical protein